MSKKKKKKKWEGTHPRCEICWNNWNEAYRAHYVAQQQGVKLWRLICKVCRQGWQDDGHARPIFKLSRKASFT